MSFFCIGNEPKSGLARDLGDCLQSRNVPFGTSGDLETFDILQRIRRKKENGNLRGTSGKRFDCAGDG